MLIDKSGYIDFDGLKSTSEKFLLEALSITAHLALAKSFFSRQPAILLIAR
jgi:hypothetical protein